MSRYWVKIGLGALFVFCLGMAGITMVQKGKAKVGAYLATVGGRIPMKLASTGFRLDGRRLGDLTGLDIDRSSGNANAVNVRVRLEDASDVAGLAQCTIAVDGRRMFDDHRGFTCAEASDLEARGYVRLGDVHFEPGDLVRPIYVSRRDFAKWDRSEIRSLQARMARNSDGTVRAQGRYDLMGHDGKAAKGTFDLSADSRGASFSVLDDMGRALVDFRSDGHGFNLNVRDRHGRNLVKLLADSLGAALSTNH